MREWLARQAGLCVSTQAAGHTTPPSASVKETALGSSRAEPRSLCRPETGLLLGVCPRGSFTRRRVTGPLCLRGRTRTPCEADRVRSSRSFVGGRAARPSRLPCRVLPRTRVCTYLCESHPGRGLLYHTVALLENKIPFGSCLLFAAAAGSFPTPTSALRGSRVSVLTSTREAVEVVARGCEAISPRGSLASPESGDADGLFPAPAAGPPRFKQRSFAEMFCKLFLTRLFLGPH